MSAVRVEDTGLSESLVADFSACFENGDIGPVTCAVLKTCTNNMLIVTSDRTLEVMLMLKFNIAYLSFGPKSYFLLMHLNCIFTKFIQILIKYIYIIYIHYLFVLFIIRFDKL